MKNDKKKLGTFACAFRGLWISIKNERNMRIHTAAALYVGFFAPFLGVSRAEYALLFVLIGMIISAEALNTAIESMCDFSCEKRDDRIRNIKDISAGAVLILAIVSVIVGVFILYRPAEILALINLIFSNLLYMVILFLSLILSIIYIVLGPLGIKNLFKK